MYFPLKQMVIKGRQRVEVFRTDAGPIPNTTYSENVVDRSYFEERRSGTVTSSYFKTMIKLVPKYVTKAGVIKYAKLRKRERRIVPLPQNAFSYLSSQITSAVGTVVQTQRSNPGYTPWIIRQTTVGPLAGTAYDYKCELGKDLSAARLAACDQKALTKLLLKAKDQKVNLVQAFAERSKTAKLIGDTAIAIANMLVNLKNGRIREAAADVGLTLSKRQAARIKRRWATDRDTADQRMSKGLLQLQYGWRPLLRDVYGSAELLAQKQTREVHNFVRSRSKDEESSQSQVKVLGGVGTLTYKNEIYREVSYRARFSSASDAIHTLSQVGVTNPTLIMWELMPWSFVIDWFLPMGNYISSLDATLGLTFIEGSKTVFTREFCECTASYDGRKNPFTSSEYKGSSISMGTKVTTDRTPLSNWPSPTLPHFKNPLSFEHAINGIALLVGLKTKLVE